MKREIIRIGTPNKLNHKYLNGQFELLVLGVTGRDPDTVQAAEAARHALLEEEAARLYKQYTAMPRKELCQLFQAYGVRCLSELICSLVTRTHMLLLSLAEAGQILSLTESLRRRRAETERMVAAGSAIQARLQQKTE